MTHGPRLAIALAIGASLTLHTPSASAQASEPPVTAEASAPGEVWNGDLDAPGGMKIGFTVTFSPNGDGTHDAMIDIPLQGATAVPLDNVSYAESEVSFALQAAGAVFSGTRDGDTITGELKQAGMTLPFELTLDPEAKASAGPPRPQHPEPPFPYEAREVSYQSEQPGVTLGGTLTIPEGDGPHPGVVLITGSGPQDRDETIFGHKPFLVIADHLTRHGIAVLRLDDRGVGASTGDISQSTAHDFAKDVNAGIEFLRKTGSIDPGRIGLIGHSEGGIIAPLVASEGDHVAFIVMLAGTGIPGKDILPMQLRTMLESNNAVPEAAVTEVMDAQRNALRLIVEDAPDAEVRAAIGELLDAQNGGQHPSPEALEASIDQQFQQLGSPWFRSFLAFDPRDVLVKVRCPVLALNGSLDFQVPPSANLPEIERALAKAPTDDFEVVELPGLNHLFQTAETGLIDEYGQIEETFSPATLERITDWILARVGP